MEGVKDLGNSRFQLCGTQNCCPEVNIQPDQLTIKDDYGGETKLNAEQALLLKKLLNEKVPG